MPTPRLMWFLFLFCFLSVSTDAQQTTQPATSDPDAVALLQKSLAALAGTAVVADVTLTGSAQRIAGSDDENGTATLKATALGDSRVDLNLPSGSRSEIRNHSALPLSDSLPPGTSGTSFAQTLQPVGAWFGPDGVVHGMAGHNIMTDATWFFPSLTLATLAASPGYVLSYVGQETHDGQSVLHISAALALQSFQQSPPEVLPMLQHLSAMDLFFDPATLLPFALAFNTHPDANALVDIATEIRFSNYQLTNGVQVPLHVQKYLANGLVLDLQFANVALNSGLPSSAFAIQ